MEISGWGNYPKTDATIYHPYSVTELQNTLDQLQGSVIARGMGRSYGDSALAEQIIKTEHLDHFLAFDSISGVLSCAAGVTLADILDVFVPKGWFLPVTPGTKFVSVGGAIASDVHGKNHHLEGSFCDHVSALKVLTVSDGIVQCSPEIHSELFRATCGGMGLTGIILEVTFRLKKIASAQMDTTTYKARNLDHALELFAEHHNSTYSVAWIDCLATSDNMGRSLVSIGEHAQRGKLNVGKPPKLSIPCITPTWLLNKHSIKAFNELYYRKSMQDVATSQVHYDPFFYPLDGIGNWNKLYGKSGFLQYQFILPMENGKAGLTQILQKIASSGKGSFLAVLKVFGKGNSNYLSFPMEGYTLALDFKWEKDLLPFLESLDAIVAEHNGRHYLAKDARIATDVFHKGYPEWQRFSEIRQRYCANKHFNSLQSIRLGL
jgi:decaprenylphospho-beta-D-ribofuranose 2-oxidase